MPQLTRPLDDFAAPRPDRASGQQTLKQRTRTAGLFAIVGKLFISIIATDSGSVAAVAARDVRPFHTFTCGLDTASVSETESGFHARVQAELLVKELDTQHPERHIFACICSTFSPVSSGISRTFV